ncbi:MAG: hypothetical protein QOE70_33 [Chthoniobacter sp.]|jgi:hypothetical protein|nr:hypothetical protein [Chthoniobacter sp.]
MSRFPSGSTTSAFRIAATLSLVLLLPASPARAAGRISFNRDIRPILSDKCFHCHGPDAKTREAKLRLDTREGLFSEIDDIFPVVPGDPARSEVLVRILTQDKDEKMPPPKSNKTLKPEEIELLREWIKQGAPFEGHWAFVAPEKPAVPPIADFGSRIADSAQRDPTRAKDLSQWEQNPIDHFLLDRMLDRGLTPSPEASPEVLVRRLCFDLTGLPPTPAEVDAFCEGGVVSQAAVEQFVDRLLGAPQYGEHMAHYWLDVVRYGDTHGLHLDNERSMWPYRDWVVKAFNDDLSFDKFTEWQLAGDLLPTPTPEQLIASGFNRCNVTTSEGGSINDELLVRYALDRTIAMSEAFMGITAGCAVCHDHKFDPLAQKEFFQLYAFFNSAADPAMDGNIALTAPIFTITSPEQQKQLDDLDGKIAAAGKRLKQKLTEIAYADPAAQDPPPEKTTRETVWLDDEIPNKAKADANAGSHPLTWVTAEDGQVFSGERALKRTDKGVAQDYFTGIEPRLAAPAKGRIFAYAWLDPDDPPQTIMLQFHTDKWSHRAAWGDIDKIQYGKKGSQERLHKGALPKTGEWVRLEVEVSELKLDPGTKFNGFAFTQFGGTVYWDKLGVTFDDDPVNDPARSQTAWEKQNQGKSPKELPKEIQNIFRSVNPKERTPEQQGLLHDYYLANIHEESRAVFEPINREITYLKTKREDFSKTFPATLIMRDLDKPRPAFVLARGQYDKPKDAVQPATPKFLPALEVPADQRPTRLDLAHWLLSPKHPLMARVTVNRFWQQFFGTGLVKTASDFGSQGEPPSHPELLDWLAVHFRESGWDVKQLVRLIVTSAAYRQDSKATPSLLEKDPENRLLARGPRFRLDAECLRDNSLALSGLLVRKLGGKGVRPYQPENIWEPVGFVGSNTREYKQDHGEALYRRSLYTFYKRTAPPPFMTSFDGPSREQTCTRRERSNTPLQALQLMNDVQHFEAARVFAERMIKEGGAQTAERLAWGFRAATARRPAADELEILQHAFSEQLERYELDPSAALKVISAGESKRDESLDPEDLAAYTLVANLILNLDEVVTRN